MEGEEAEKQHIEYAFRKHSLKERRKWACSKRRVQGGGIVLVFSLVCFCNGRILNILQIFKMQVNMEKFHGVSYLRGWEVLSKATSLDNSTSVLVVIDGVGGLRYVDVERRVKSWKLTYLCFLSIIGCKNTVRGIANSSLKTIILFFLVPARLHLPISLC